MRLLIRNKFFSLKGSSTVLDENDQPKFLVEGKLFSITHKKRIMDLDKNLLYKVRNKFWKFFLKSALIYDADGNKVAKVKQKFSLKRSFYVIGYEDEIRVEGDIIGWSFKIFKNDTYMGAVSRKFDITDAFILDIEEDENAAFLLALVIAMDNIFDRK